VDNSEFGFNVGAGAMGFFTDHVGIRGDVRYLRSFVDPDEDNEFDLGVGNFDYWRAARGLPSAGRAESLEHTLRAPLEFVAPPTTSDVAGLFDAAGQLKPFRELSLSGEPSSRRRPFAMCARRITVISETESQRTRPP
jgi:hypothetical protein